MDHLLYNLLNGTKMTDRQISAYLCRIGLDEDINCDLQGLTRLHQAHQRHVPFENLDVLAGRTVSLRHEDLFEKIVERRRGGLCAELNTAYNWLLYSLGFDTVSFNSRVVYPDQPIGYEQHRVICVKLQEGCWLTDVGSNLEFSRVPLPMRAEEITDDGCCSFRILPDPVYGYCLQRRRAGQNFVPSLMFQESPRLDVDFIPVVYYFEHQPQSTMRRSPRISLFYADHFTAIRNHAYLVEQGGLHITTRQLEREQEQELIRSVFGLEWDGVCPE